MKMMRFVPVGLLVAFSSSIVLSGASGYKVKPWTYDPDKLGIAGAGWVTHEGLPDAGTSNHALFLFKSGKSSANAAGGATVEIPAPTTLSSLGFDYLMDGHCGAGAPRFNVYTDADHYYFFGCFYGTHSPAGNGWEHVSFSAADAFASDPANMGPFVFDQTPVVGIEIVFDEGTLAENGDPLEGHNGYAYLDNIVVNGITIGEPGVAPAPGQ
jgi:hypothetical protein